MIGNNFKAMRVFQGFISELEVIVYIPKNGEFTWTNRREGFTRIVERLDRFLVGLEWMTDVICCEFIILPFSTSDHYLIMLGIKRSEKPKVSTFKFSLMW